jgi:FAD binding domain
LGGQEGPAFPDFECLAVWNPATDYAGGSRISLSWNGGSRPYLKSGFPSNPENRYNSRHTGSHLGNPRLRETVSAHGARGFDEVNLLTVAVDRLPLWHKPGLLCIGDAAHAMSPVGGVGINLAIQTANILAGSLSGKGPLSDQLQHARNCRG